MRISSLLAAVGAAMCVAASPAVGGSLARVFVRADAAPGGDGNSWATAYDNVQDALDRVGGQSGDERGVLWEIWVAQGVYTPTKEYFKGLPRSVTFEIPDLTAVYGGFWGDEDELGPVPPITERRYTTTFTGDVLDNDDVGGQGPLDDNAWHVVRLENADVRIDGVTIRSGRATGGKDNQGAGVYIIGDFSDVTIANSRVEGNGASSDGGGVFSNGGRLRLESCLISGNSVSNGAGAGVYANLESLVVVNTAFLGNFSFGGSSQGGGLFTNSTFATVVNSTFVSNVVFGTGAGGLQSGSATPAAVRNSVFWNNGGSLKSVELQQLDGPVMSVSTTCIQDLGFFYSGENGNIGDDPLLMPIAPGGDTMWNTPDDVLGVVISPNSPVRNIGNNGVDTDASLPGVQPLPPTDMRGLVRIVDCNDAMPPATVDLGATEVQAGEPAYWVRSDAGFWSAPSNWLRFVLGEGCNSASFVGLDGSTLLSDVQIPGEYLAQTASIRAYNAEVDVLIGSVSFLDATGDFAGIDGEIFVDRGVLRILGDFQTAATKKLRVGDQHPAEFFLQSQLDVEIGTTFSGAGIMTVGGLESSVSDLGQVTMSPHATDMTQLSVEVSSVSTDGMVVGQTGSALAGVSGEFSVINTQGALTIGLEPGSQGFAQVGADASWTVSGPMIVGDAGDGEFFNQGQASAMDLLVGASPGGVGRFSAEPGSTTSVSGNIEIGSFNEESGAPGVGQLVIHSPSFFGGQVAAVSPGSSIIGVGQLDLPVDNRGVISPGLPEGFFPGDEMTIDGWYLQQRTPGQQASQSGSLVIDLGTVKGENFADRLIVSDFASLGGGLYLRPYEFFNPAPGSLGLPVVEAGSIIGQFDVVFTPFFNDGRFLRVRYENGKGPGAAVTVYVDSTNGSLSFDEGEDVDVPAGASASSAAVDFFDNDAFIDLAVALPADDPMQLGCVLVLLNQGNGGGGEWNGYTVAQCITVGRDPSAVATGDVNGDGRPDIIAANRLDNTVSVLVNDGMGDFSFLPPITLAVGAAPVDVAVADLNDDTFLDIVTANQDGGGVSVLFGTAPGVFAPAMSVPTGLEPSALTIADFSDAPGLEIAVANRGSGTITVIGDNTLFGIGGLADIDLGDGAVPDDLDSGDVDNDKDIDIVASDQQPTQGPSGNTSGSVVVIRRDRAAGLGAGPAFASPVSIPAGAAPGSLALTDMDGDGDDDIAVVTSDENRGDAGEFVRLIRNDLVPADGQLIFSPWQDVPTGNEPTFVLPSDVNNDGLDDIITLNIIENVGLLGVSTSQISVLLNAYEPPVPGDINGDGLTNMSDLAILLGNYSMSGIGIPGDVDGDGFVGFNDLNIILSNFNQ